MKMVLNGGHCPGKDPGAVGARAAEADICRSVMEQAALMLRDHGHEVLTVQTDELGDIVGASDGYGAAVFVSIHCNAAANQAAQGTEVYAASEAGNALAECLRQRIVGSLGTVDRGVKDGSHLYVVRNTAAVAVLVELAFISNAADEALLIGRTAEFAAAVTGGFMNYASGEEGA